MLEEEALEEVLWEVALVEAETLDAGIRLDRMRGVALEDVGGVEEITDEVALDRDLGRVNKAATRSCG